MESSPVQHLTAAGNPNWWKNGGLRPPPPQLPPSTTTYLLPSFLPLFPSPTSSSLSLPRTSNPNFSSWPDNSDDLPLDQPWSLSQLLFSEIGESSFANKKPKVQVPSSPQSTLKVRKEKLGGRIAALHQLVSPFGKALSLPYFGVPSRNNMIHQLAQGGMNCLFPEDPGQRDLRFMYLRYLFTFFYKNSYALEFKHPTLVNEYCMKRSKGASLSSSTNNQESNPNEEPEKDLRSRGLCLVPISCTLQVGNDNGADYWTPAF
ncbi:unnamed protein product [Arabis nemorensis]|uniref:BHLH domain-containing protein n=1 Tax=Arabis nemorensis TaxID=586526 RepID=A0A565BDX1_9BRAS|nr:unnamed protein product [Arabis nemorensis]